MYTNKTGEALCADKDGNIVPCDDPRSAFVVVGEGSQISAEEARKYKGLPTGDDNDPPEEPDGRTEEPDDGDPGDQQPAPAPAPEAKAEEAPPANKMEFGKATKAERK